MDNIIRVYDRNMNKLAYLNNAYGIGYELSLNELWYAIFSMPADDPKNQYCQPFNYVEIFDGGERIELFRIMPSTLTRNTQGHIVYECEHVLATLLDDVMFQYHQIGNIGIGTVQVLRYVLDRQIDKRWQLGICEFDRRFEYKWENENLLAALFSIPKPFSEGYRWEFDTTGTVWRIHLKRLPTQFKADIVYKKNMSKIEKEVDPTTIVTRLYCLGYGEGDNQLGIESVNNGIPYLESNGATTTWGIKTSILVDRRFESPETLKAYGQSLLNELKHPYKSYTVGAVDLYRKSPEKYEKFVVGDIVRIVDKEDGITEDLPIVKVSKSDITGNIGDIQIEIANKSRDIAGSMSELQDRTRINEVYAQGATNQMMIPFADNADPKNPAIMRIYIPDTMARINKCILNYQLESFRAYSKAIEGGGGFNDTTLDGNTKTTTTEAGSIDTTTTEAGSIDIDTTETEMVVVEGLATDISFYSGGVTLYTDDAPDHNHGLGKESDLAKPGGGYVTFVASGGHSHKVDGHAHDVYVETPKHSHALIIDDHSHDIKIDPHSHSINLEPHSHSLNIPDHKHELQFGIYQGERADRVTIKVDGKAIPQTQSGDDIDIVKYLSTDKAGKINRNTWHTIEIVPNKMTRVVSNVFMQIFTNSRGGGDF